MKNWKAIATIGNQQLRLTAISAKGEVEAGLAVGFPQYFLPPGATAELPKRGELFSLLREAKQRDQVLEILKEVGIPHQRFGFEGSARGMADGLSYADGGYHTNNYGTLQYFYRSSKMLGQEVEYEGAVWLVVWNVSSSGSPEEPDRHTLIIVPAAAIV
jgi:hypothetical protein